MPPYIQPKHEKIPFTTTATFEAILIFTALIVWTIVGFEIAYYF